MSEKPVTTADLAPAGVLDNPRQADGGARLAGDMAEPAPELDQPAAKGWKFWAVFPPLCIATLLMALESTVTSTALPMITADLGSGDNYVWFLNGYLLTA